MGKYTPPNDLPDEMTDAELAGSVDVTLDNVALKLLAKAESRAISKLSAATGELDASRFNKTYSGGFITSNEPTELAGLKATFSPETNQARDNALREMGIPSHERDRKNLMGAWFQTKMRLGTRQSATLAEDIRKDEQLGAILKVSMAGDVDTSGGHMVPNLVANEVLKMMRDASKVYGRARQVPMGSDTLSFPDETTACTVNWATAQGQTLTQGEPVFGVKTLTAARISGRATFSLELLDDANVAIIPFLQSCFAEKLGGELDFQAMEGVGTPFTGVSGATSVSDCARTNGTNGVQLSYASNTSTYASLVQIFTKAAESYTRDDGIFVCGPGVYAKILGLTDTNGQPIVRLGAVENQPGNTLFGRPIVVSNRLGVTTIGAGTNSVGSLYFGPPSALVFGTRRALRFDVSDQVNWEKYQADCRLVGRFGYVVGIGGAWAKQAGIIVS